jgi:hypothetical protein
VAEIVLLGRLEVPRELLPLVQVLATEQHGKIAAAPDA